MYMNLTMDCCTLVMQLPVRRRSERAMSLQRPTKSRLHQTLLQQPLELAKMEAPASG
jgi:hypothetical protein